FDRPASASASLPPVRLELAGLDAQAEAAVRKAVLAAMASARLPLAGDAGGPAWTLELRPAIDGAPGAGAMIRWVVVLRDATGGQAMRATYAGPLAGDRINQSLAASARVAIESARVAMTDELRSARRTEVAAR